MKHLILNRLFVLSSTQELAGQYQFKKGLNLITGIDNSIGKSTLARLPYWTFGCDFPFSDTWRGLDVKAILEFTVDGQECTVARSRRDIHLKIAEQPWQCWKKITGEYSEVFAKLVGFVGKLPNKANPHIQEIPPPAYYFSAFYVDQKKGWAQAWDSFESLQQFSDWKEKVIRAHVGYYSADYFELGADIAEMKHEVKEKTARAQEFSRAASVMQDFLPAVEMSATTAELDAAMVEINQTLVGLRAREAHALAKLQEKREEAMFFKVQRSIAETAISELNKDYVFAVENVPQDTLTCPLCGTLHDNSLINRAGLLQDKAQAQTQLDLLNGQFSSCEKSIQLQESRLAKIRKTLTELEGKFKRISRDAGVRDILGGLASSTVRQRAEEATSAARINARSSSKIIKALEKARRETIDVDKWATIDVDFQDELLSLCGLLRVTLTEGLSDKTVVDYRRIADSGGAAEGARLHLAYQLALFYLIEKHGSEVISPLVLDTPNQQDQAPMNYDVIHKAIMKYVRKNGQLILCATRSPALEQYEATAHVIELSNEKLLSSSHLAEVLPRFDKIFKIAGDAGE